MRTNTVRIFGSVLVMLLLASVAFADTILDQRQAAEIAYRNYISEHGEIMLPEYSIRCDDVDQHGDVFEVTVTLYDVIQQVTIQKLAVYTIDGISGKILEIRDFADGLRNTTAGREEGALLTEREAGKIAYVDFIRQNQLLLENPEQKVRVSDVKRRGASFIVILALVNSRTGEEIMSLAEYQISAKNGSILNSTVTKTGFTSQDELNPGAEPYFLRLMDDVERLAGRLQQAPAAEIPGLMETLASRQEELARHIVDEVNQGRIEILDQFATALITRHNPVFDSVKQNVIDAVSSLLLHASSGNTGELATLLDGLRQC